MIVFRQLLMAASASAALTLCSSQNSGEDFQSVFGQFQSNGACSEMCNGYAFAILQGQKCWCSDIAPSKTTSLNSCSDSCAGYPDDKCGNMMNGLFGYIQLGQASGTMSASSSKAPSSTAKPSSSTKPKPSSTSESSQSTPSSTTTETSETSTTESKTTSDSASSTDTSESSSTTNKPSVSVLTVLGGEKTVTVGSATPTSDTSAESATSSAEPQNKDDDDDGFFSNKGKVAGVFTAVGVIIAALIAGLIFFLIRRRNRKYDDDDDDDELTVGSGGSPTGSPWRSKRASVVGAVGGGAVGRSQSTRTTLAGGDHRGNGLGTSPNLTTGKLRIDETSGSDNHDMMRAQSETSILGSMGMMDHHDDSSNTPGRSLAANMSQVHEVPVVDQRLDPSQMVLQYDGGADDNRHSLQDDADYSRRILRVTNPDYFG